MAPPAAVDAQIRTDVARTLTGHPFFEKNQGSGQTALYHVLRAYCVFDQELEYCQGTSFIVGHLLLRMSEEEAFWMLVQVRARRPDLSLARGLC